MCERARCHSGETNCFSSTCLDFAPKAIPQPLQNNTVKLAIDGLTRGYKFLVDCALDAENNDQHGLDISANLKRFFRPRWIWRLPLRRLLFSLRVITIHPYFITGYDIGDEVGVSLACCLSSLQTETRRAFWSTLSSLGTNLTEMCLFFKLSAKMRWKVPYDIPTISEPSWIVCTDSLANFCYVFQCCACRPSSRTLIVADRFSSVPEAFVP